MSGRRKARELALQASYAFELSGNTADYVVNTTILEAQEPPAVSEFAIGLFRKTIEKKEEYDKLIMARVANWEFGRIAIIDKIILRIIICEFLTYSDIPPKVSIDEGIEIAKKFSTEQSGRFVNGIADAILSDLQKNGKLSKNDRDLASRD